MQQCISSSYCIVAVDSHLSLCITMPSGRKSNEIRSITFFFHPLKLLSWLLSPFLSPPDASGGPLHAWIRQPSAVGFRLWSDGPDSGWVAKEDLRWVVPKPGRTVPQETGAAAHGALQRQDRKTGRQLWRVGHTNTTNTQAIYLKVPVHTVTYTLWIHFCFMELLGEQKGDLQYLQTASFVNQRN